MSKTPLHEKFESDKTATISGAQEFLQSHSESQAITKENLQSYRDDAVNFVSEGKLTEALQSLERLRDAKTGIVTHEVIKDNVPIVVRDARKAQNPPALETEAFEMQYLNAIRASIDIATIQDKPELTKDLKQKALDFIKNFSSNHRGESQKELAGLLKKETKILGKLLEDRGIPDAYEKLNVAKDFQNFNDKHSNIVTISSINHNEQTHTVIEAEVAMKGLTTSQKEQYAAITDDTKPNKPSWYTALPKWEQGLCQKYASKIAAGEHVIPTQLRQIAGMKNAFEKITAIFEKGELEVLHTSKHAGTLASLAKDKDAKQDITNENAKQAQEWVGPDKTLHCNTFNSGPLGAGDDPEIVRSTTKAMKEVGGKETNTAFNSFRYSGLANDLGGVKDTLKKLAEALPEGKEFEKIKSHIKPKGFFGRIFRTGNAEQEIQNLLKSEKIDNKTAEILTNSIDLRRSVEKADSILRFGDAENASLATSTKLNKLTKTLSNLESLPKGFIKLPKEEILNMCASGKDRTGLAEHDQSAQAIADKIGATVKNIDGQLLSSLHTAQQAGGISSGGATTGCYGTKSENRAGLPASRQKDLEAIIEVTASSNKIKGTSKLKEPKIVVQKVKTPEVQKDQTTKPQTSKAQKVQTMKIETTGSLKPPPTPNIKNNPLQKKGSEVGGVSR
jgi:hypothetical protein